MSGVVRYRSESGVRLGWMSASESVQPLRERNWAELFDSGRPTVVEEQLLVDTSNLLCPVERPGKVLCAGINYGCHKSENPAAVLPQVPFFLFQVA